VHRLNPLIKVSHIVLPRAVVPADPRRSPDIAPQGISLSGKIVFPKESQLRHSVKKNPMCLKIGQQFPMLMEIRSLEFAGLCLYGRSLDVTDMPG